MQLVIKPRARRELARADAWWSANRPAAPDALFDEFNAAVRAVHREPGLGSPWRSRTRHRVRRHLMSTTQYWVYYRVRGNTLEVLSVWHTGRGHGPSV